MRLLIVIDDQSHVLMGTCCLLNGAIRHLSMDSVIIAGTKKALSKLQHAANKFLSNSRIAWLSIKHLNNNDPYSLKISAFQKVLSDSHGIDVLCYIDYDHIVASEIVFDVLKETIIVSSEHATSNYFGPHYNTSLIVGCINLLRVLLPHWIETYLTLQNKIPNRHLEEIAFSEASRRVQVKVQHASLLLQGNFINKNIGGLFHYGGETACSSSIKSFLAQMWPKNKNDLTRQVIDSIESHIFENIIGQLDRVHPTVVASMAPRAIDDERI
ncbi:MAG: hypothetical protein EOM59_16095 [Clostridia bacterium]|nr:hypothetical protein [Clostridia bacterium]